MQRKNKLPFYTKRLFLIVCLVLAWGSLFAQDHLFKQFEDTPGVSTVYISPTMFKLIPKMEVGDKDIAKIASKLTKLQILECERPSLIPSIKKQALAYYEKNRYEVVMKAKSSDDRTTIYQKKRGKDSNEFVLFNEEKGELSIIQVVGNISLNDIKDLND